MIIFVYLMLMAGSGESPFEVKQVFDAIPTDQDLYLTLPYDADIDQVGNVYIADPKEIKIHIWNADGSYKKSFGKPGEGPGELAFPTLIQVEHETIYVWDSGRQAIFLYDLEGNVVWGKMLPGIKLRAFAPIEKKKLILAGELYRGQQNPQYYLAEYNLETGIMKDPKWLFTADLFHEAKAKSVVFKAYSGTIFLDKNAADDWWFSYTNDPNLITLDEKLNKKNVQDFNLLLGPPTPIEVELHRELSYPGVNQARITPAQMEGVSFNYDGNKGYFSHVHQKDDMMYFLMSPAVGLNGMGTAYHEYSYYKYSLKQEKVISIDHFSFPEDSRVFFKENKILGCILDDSGDFKVKKLEFK